MKTHYETLGVPQNATDDDIKTAYRNLSKKYHPDNINSNETNSERFTEVHTAYQTLKDPVLRAEYNDSLRNNNVHHQNSFKKTSNKSMSEKETLKQAKNDIQIAIKKLEEIYNPMQEEIRKLSIVLIDNGLIVNNCKSAIESSLKDLLHNLDNQFNIDMNSINSKPLNRMFEAKRLRETEERIQEKKQADFHYQIISNYVRSLYDESILSRAEEDKDNAIDDKIILKPSEEAKDAAIQFFIGLKYKTFINKIMKSYKQYEPKMQGVPAYMAISKIKKSELEKKAKDIEKMIDTKKQNIRDIDERLYQYNQPFSFYNNQQDSNSFGRAK